jgi:hypothetical protein
MLLYDVANVSGTIAVNTEMWLVPRNISMQRDMEMDATGYIKVKEGDVINVTFPDCSWTGNVRMMVAILCYTTTKVRCQYVQNIMEQPGISLPHKTLTIVIRQNGFIRLLLYNQSAAISDLSFGVSEYSGYAHVVRIEQQIPDFVANKGALVSSDVLGDVAFDENGVMRYNDPNRSLDGNYWLSRPDLWPNGVQVKFPGKLAGIRFAGSYSTGAANENVQLTLGNDTIFPDALHRPLEYGGHAGGVTNSPDLKFPVNCYGPYVASNGTNISNIIALKTSSVRVLQFNHKDNYAALNTTYDFWVKYVLS